MWGFTRSRASSNDPPEGSDVFFEVMVSNNRKLQIYKIEADFYLQPLKAQLLKAPSEVTIEGLRIKCSKPDIEGFSQLHIYDVEEDYHFVYHHDRVVYLKVKPGLFRLFLQEN